MRKVFLIRVGMDSSYGGFVSPIFPDESYVVVPIPNERKNDTFSDRLKRYSQLKVNPKTCPKIVASPLTDFLPYDRLVIKEEKKPKLIKDVPNTVAHDDPEFDTMTYGEKKGACAEVKNYQKGDYVVFYAGFFPVDYGCKYNSFKLAELQNKQKNRKRYYIFAFLELMHEPVNRENCPKYESEIQKNVHYVRGDFQSDDPKESGRFILKGTANSGWIKPKRIDDGHPIGSNYQMTDAFAQFKRENKDARGLNKCYCPLKDSIIPLLVERKL